MRILYFLEEMFIRKVLAPIIRVFRLSDDHPLSMFLGTRLYWMQVRKIARMPVFPLYLLYEYEHSNPILYEALPKDTLYVVDKNLFQAIAETEDQEEFKILVNQADELLPGLSEALFMTL